MPRHLFSSLSNAFSVFSDTREELLVVNKIFGSHSSFSPKLRNLFTAPYVMETGSRLLSDEEKRKLDRLKVRQGLSFLAEAEKQMERLFLMLNITEPEESHSTKSDTHEDSTLLVNYLKLSGRKLTTDLGKTVSKKALSFAGGLAGATMGPAGAIVGGFTGGAVGSIAAKRLCKNIELSLSKKRYIDARLKRLYVSTREIDLALSKAYTLGYLNNMRGLKTEAILKNSRLVSCYFKFLDIYSCGWLDMSLIANQVDIAYQACKVNNGYSSDKLAKISWLMEELAACLLVEMRSIKQAYLRLHPNGLHDDPGLHRGKMNELDECLYFGFPKYKTPEERALRYTDIELTYCNTMDTIKKSRDVIHRMRSIAYDAEH